MTRKEFSVEYASNLLKGRNALFAEVFNHGTLLIEFYKPLKADHQRPHERDEIYVIASGTGTFHNAGNESAFKVGDVLFVAAGDKHYFKDFSDDFSTWVFFFGPFSGEKEFEKMS